MRPTLVEAGLEHPLHMLGEIALHLVEAEPQAAEDSELLFLREPARAVRSLAYLRNLIPHSRRRVLHPEIARHPGHIDVAIGGDDAVAHRLTSLKSKGTAGPCTAEDIALRQPAVKTGGPRRRQFSCTDG